MRELISSERVLTHCDGTVVVSRNSIASSYSSSPSYEYIDITHAPVDSNAIQR